MINADQNLVNAFQKASSNWDKAFDRPASGSDLSIYNSLKPEDFPKIATKYGVPNTVNYIHTMEHQRMKGG